MGPKKKGKGKGKQKSLLGAYPVHEMTVAELQEYALKLQEEIDKTMVEAEYFEKETEQMQMCWDRSKRKLERKKMEFQAKEEELKDMEIMYDQLAGDKDMKLKCYEREDHRLVSDQIVQQGFERVEYEQQNLFDEKVTEDRVIRKADEARTFEATYERLQQEMRRARCKELSELLPFCERRFNRLFEKYDELFTTVWHDVNKDKHRLIEAIKDSRESQLEQVSNRKDYNYQHMREYFTRIAFDCLAFIGDLKKELESLKKSTKEQKILLHESIKENRMLKKLDEEAEIGESTLQPYKKDKKEFAEARKRMHDLKQKVKDLEFENHMLSEKYRNILSQKKNLEDRFFEAVGKLQSSISLKNVFLQKKASLLKKIVERETYRRSEKPLEDGDSSSARKKWTRNVKLSDVKDKVTIVNLSFPHH